MTAASGADAPVAIINPIATRQGPFSCRKNPELTAECLKKIARNTNDPCGAKFPKVL
jgi:hypothetical protein